MIVTRFEVSASILTNLNRVIFLCKKVKKTFKKELLLIKDIIRGINMINSLQSKSFLKESDCFTTALLHKSERNLAWDLLQAKGDS